MADRIRRIPAWLLVGLVFGSLALGRAAIDIDNETIRLTVALIVVCALIVALLVTQGVQEMIACLTLTAVIGFAVGLLPVSETTSDLIAIPIILVAIWWLVDREAEAPRQEVGTHSR